MHLSGNACSSRPSLLRRIPDAITSRSASASAPLTQSVMAEGSSAMARIADQLGRPLYTACLQNNVAQVEILTSAGMDTDKWSAAMLAAASEKAMDVTSYCVQHIGNGIATTDVILWRVLSSETLYPAYYFLVDWNVVDVRHCIDRTGPLLSVAAGSRHSRRHALVEFLLKRGADPNDRAEMHGGLRALASAAGNSDKKMVELLLDYGAQMSGSGAITSAAQKGNIANVEYLLARGADVNEMEDLSERTLSREELGSPLHKAVEHGQLGVVDTLISAGADVTLKDGKGRTARDIAEKKRLDANVLAMLSQR